jgi:serine/threonine protein kinase
MQVSTSEMPTERVERTAPTRSGRARARAPASSQDLVLGRYRLGRRLGTGAFGTVYAARDERLERDVAVKLLPRERVVGGRFEREARAAARLQHPAIVTLYEAVVDDEGAYLVSELVRGRTLDELVVQGHLSDRAILQIVISLCDALAHAHEQGVIHRDVKPSNVLVPARPSSPAHPAKLTDFGVATVVGGDALTRTGDVVGTAAYMAPEQAAGREATPAADLYALALVAYEALTGVNPLRQSRLAAHAAARPTRRLAVHLPPLRRQRRDLPRELGAGIDQALRPRPSERGTVEDLRESLALALPHAGERTGVVTSRWTPRPLGTATAATATAGAERGPGEEWYERPARRLRLTGPRAGEASEPLGAEDRRQRLPASRRALAAAGAGVAIAWAAAHVPASAPVTPAAAGLIAAAAVLLLPRLGWLTATGTLALLAMIQSRPGTGLVLIAAVAAGAVMLAPARELWPAPAGAVALGLIGLAGAWPAVAGLAPRQNAYRRAALGAAGYLWLTGAGALVGHRLYWLPGHLPAPGTFAGSLQVTLQDVLAPILTAPALAGALVWALAAAVLPWLVSGRRPLPELLLATVWSAATVAAVAATGAGGALRDATLGAVAAAVVALLPAARSVLRAPGVAAEVP